MSRQSGSFCKARTKNGKPCKAPPTEGGLCFFHANPDRARKLGQLGGRKNRRRTLDASEFAPLSPGAVRQMLAQAMVGLQENKLSPRSATALAQVSSVLLRAIQASDLEERVAQLEREAERRSSFERGDTPTPIAAEKKEDGDGSSLPGELLPKAGERPWLALQKTSAVNGFAGSKPSSPGKPAKPSRHSRG